MLSKIKILIKISLLFSIFSFPPAQVLGLSPCPISKSVEVWNNCKGAYIDSMGGKYIGKWKNGKFDGQGITTFESPSKWEGDKYIGGWKNGKKYGQGTYIYADETFKEGVWFNDQFLYEKKAPSLKKKSVKKAPQKLTPQKPPEELLPCFIEEPVNKWTNCIGTHSNFDLENVPPVVRLEAKDYLINTLETDPAAVTQLITDLMTGLQAPDETTSNIIDKLSGYGGKYTGSWKDGKFDGKGVATFGAKTRWANEKYKGEFKAGKREGKGIYSYTDGSIYEGVFVNGMWHGEGSLTNSFGDKYVGQFKDGKRHGKGTVTSANGHSYIGIFRNDIATGNGKLLPKKP